VLAAIKSQFEEAKTNAPDIYLSCETLIASGQKRLKSGWKGAGKKFSWQNCNPSD